MTKHYVVGVLIVKYTSSNYKALYGRIPNSTTYTKDYIQIPEAISEELRAVLENGKDRVEIEYVWPGGGSQPGHFHWSADRYHLKWDTNDPPPPWKLGNVGTDPVASLSGNTSMRTEAAGDSQLEQIKGADNEPWLLAVQLAGQSNRLHLRVYFENPPAQLPARGIDQLPVKLQREINDLAASPAGSSFVNWSSDIPPSISSVRAKKLVEEIQEALSRDPNVLLIGPPGTGKSVALEDLSILYSSKGTASVLFDPESWDGDWSDVDEPPARCIALTFHASYMYENFVAGLYPKSSGLGIELNAVPGPLLCLSHWVGDSERRGLLILDEFNRGSAAAIFGDTLSLLDKDKRSTGPGTGTHLLRPYSGQPMPVPASFAKEKGSAENIVDEIGIPANVHVVAAMNSTDRSVAPVDAALRRRFTVIRVMPDYDLLADHLGISMERSELPVPEDGVGSWQIDDVSALAIRMLRGLNERIEFCLGEDFLLGHGLLWSLVVNDAAERLKQLAYCVDSLIVPTLRMTFVDQDEALAAVLGVPEELQSNAVAETPIDGTVAYWKLAPPELDSIVSRRLFLRTLHKMDVENQVEALVALAARS